MSRRNRIDESLITVEELAEMLNISRPSVYRRLKEGRIPQPLRFGRSVRWNQWQIQEWLDDGAPPDERCATPSEPPSGPPKPPGGIAMGARP